jgi:DNA (cytosine-5)-methyltransferase 1
MFGLPIIRHRCFESNVQLDTLLPACDHPSRPVLITGHYSSKGRKVDFSLADKRTAMRTPWLTARRITEALPPAYTEHLGRQLLQIT